MKKICLFLFLNFIFSSLALAMEATPLQLDGASQATFFEIEEDTTSLINVDNMKKSDKIKQMNEKTKNEQKMPKIKLDEKAIDHQRALNFMQHQNNTMVPIF